MLKIYGKRQSRAARCLWVAEEMGLAYEQIPIDTQNGDAKSKNYLALNPAGKVPIIDHDGFVLRESIAITYFLVTRATTPLWPDDVQTQARIHQWSSWAVTDMEFPLNSMFRENRRAKATACDADPGYMAAHIELASKTLQVLEDHLERHRHVVGESFTLGDINAYTAAMLAPMFLDMARYPAVQVWLTRCSTRPAWTRVQALP